MTFKPDTTFNSSHKMGEAKISLDKALIKFPEHNDASDDGKVEHGWSGSFKAKDGTEMRASFWCWKGSLRHGGYVSLWVSNQMYLPEFIRYIEA